MLVARVHVKSRASERRWNVRRPVELEAVAKRKDEDEGYTVTIQNLSENGLMFETWGAFLDKGDTIEVELPDYGNCSAEIVWIQDHAYGGRFFKPIPKAVISAAVLKSPFLSTLVDIEEQPEFAHSQLEGSVAKRPLIGWSMVALSLLLIAVCVFLYALMMLPIG